MAKAYSDEGPNSSRQDGDDRDVATATARIFQDVPKKEAGHRGAAVGRLAPYDDCAYGLPGSTKR